VTVISPNFPVKGKVQFHTAEPSELKTPWSPHDLATKMPPPENPFGGKTPIY